MLVPHAARPQAGMAAFVVPQATSLHDLSFLLWVHAMCFGLLMRSFRNAAFLMI
jgi:hypothetical protein